MPTTNAPGNNSGGNNTRRVIGIIALVILILFAILDIVLPVLFGTTATKNVVPILNEVVAIFATIFTLLQVFPELLEDLVRIFSARSFRMPTGKQLFPALVALVLLFIVLNIAQAAIIVKKVQGLATTPASFATATHSVTPVPSLTSTPPPVPTTPTSTTPTVTFPSYIPGTGTLVMNDPLVDNSRGYNWVNFTSNSGSCMFTAKGYQFKSSNYFQNCQEYGVNNLTNFVLEVTVSPQSGSEGGYILRNTGNSGNGYYIDFGPSGYYAMKRDEIYLKQSTLSPLIPKNQPSYLVGIELSGNQITLYINKKMIGTVTDSTYSQGRIGFFVTGDCPTCANTEVTFKNLSVWSI